MWFFLPWEMMVIKADAGGNIFIRELIILNKSTLFESLGPSF